MSRSQAILVMRRHLLCGSKLLRVFIRKVKTSLKTDGSRTAFEERRKLFPLTDPHSFVTQQHGRLNVETRNWFACLATYPAMRHLAHCDHSCFGAAGTKDY